MNGWPPAQRSWPRPARPAGRFAWGRLAAWLGIGAGSVWLIIAVVRWLVHR